MQTWAVCLVAWLGLPAGAQEGRPLAGPNPAAPSPAGGAGIAARINNEVITWDEVELEVRKVPSEQRTEDVRRQILRDLATRRLFLQQANKLKLKITDERLYAVFREEEKAFMDSTKNKSADAFIKYIRRTRNMTVSEYLEELRILLLTNQVIAQVYRDPTSDPALAAVLQPDFVSPDEVRAYYVENPKEFKAIREINVIRLKLPYHTAQEREEKLRLGRSIQKRLEQGADLEVLSYYYGDVGGMPLDPRLNRTSPYYIGLKPEDSPFEPATNRLLFETLEEGALSDLVEDRYSINIFMIHSKIDKKAMTFEEAQPKILERLENEKRSANRRALFAELKRRAFVDPPDLFK